MNFSTDQVLVCKARFFFTHAAALILSVLTLSVLTLSASACRANTKSRAQESVWPKGEIMRIISATPSNTEIITGLGMGDRLIAVDKYSRGITGVPEGLPEIDFFYPDTEAVIGLEPDLIISNEINSFGVANNPFKLLGDMGIKVVQIPTSASIEGIYGDIILIARAMGVKERGEALVDSMKKEIESIAALRVKKTTEQKTVYVEVSAVPSLISFGRETFLNEMIEIAGGKNIFADQTGWFSPSVEEIINRNPDIIIAIASPGEDPVSEIKSRASFQSISALKENQVYAVDADSVSRPSHNILLALRQMAQAISPAAGTAAGIE